MNAHDAIRSAYDMSTNVIKSYVNDLSDAELLERPHAECNSIAWQLGHLISSTNHLLEVVRPGSGVALPAGFHETYGREMSKEIDPTKFLSRQEYMDLWDQTEAAALKTLDQLTAEDLDQPGPEKYRSFLPTVGRVYLLIAQHGLMHAGQFVPVRRALGKPVKI